MTQDKEWHCHVIESHDKYSVCHKTSKTINEIQSFFTNLGQIVVNQALALPLEYSYLTSTMKQLFPECLCQALLSHRRIAAEVHFAIFFIVHSFLPNHVSTSTLLHSSERLIVAPPWGMIRSRGSGTAGCMGIVCWTLKALYIIAIVCIFLMSRKMRTQTSSSHQSPRRVHWSKSAIPRLQHNHRCE